MKSTSADAKGLIWLGNTDDRPGDDPRFNRWMREAVASEVAEANRLWYVALTRARQYLVLSGQARETAKQLAPLLEGLPLLTHEKLTSALHETSELQTVDLNYVVHSPLASQPDLDIPARLETKVARISRSIPGGDKRGTLAAVEEPEQEKHAPRPDAGKVKNAPLLASGVKTLVASRFAAAALDEQETPAVSAPLEGSSRMSSVLAAAFGTFVHATLEHHVQYGRIETFDAQRVWARICSKSMIVAGRADAQKALAEAIAHAREVVSSPVWTNLLNKLPRKRTEVPVAMLGADATLHQGTMDLVMDDGVEDVVGQRAPTQILVVDYKTSLNGDADESSRKAHESQVRSYMEFLKGTWPQAKITACLLYTRTMTVREVT
jgi:ATP-dependent exoDNAse (exonuclease V) beta subunit